MNPLSLNTLAIVLLVIGVSGMVVPTAAIPTEDRPWADDPDIVLEPSPGPNGDYASIDGDGNLSVDISNVNVEAVTTVEDVFTVTNNEGERYAVWVSHDANESVEFLVDGRSIEDADDPLLLDSGERRNVSLEIDTRGRAPNEQLMSELTLHARTSPASAGGSSGGSSAGGSNATSSTGSPTTTATPGANGTPNGPISRSPTPGPVVETVVEIEFGVRTGGPTGPPPPYTVRELDPTALDAEDPRAPPEAVITHATGGPAVIGMDTPPLGRKGVDVVTTVGEPVFLSGTRSLVGHAGGVDPDRRIAKLVAVEVPAEHRSNPARIRITAARAAFGATDPRQAVVGRRVAGGGWQLLETTVVSVTDRTVTLEAVTPGFSTFAVFTRADVRYRWTLPDGTTVDGQRTDATFDRPGRYEVTLTVTDALGRSDTSTYQVVANDRPTVVIEGLEAAAGDGPSTLRADVTDEVGNVTVTWVFADGSTAVGESVTREFAADETVRVVVEDEFGAETRVRGTVGEAFRAGSRDSFGPIEFSLGLTSQVAFTGLAVVLLIMGARRVAARRYGLG